MPMNEWDKHYQERANAHRVQNETITRDFAASLPVGSPIHNALMQSRRVLDVGCGTGEFSAWIAGKFGSSVIGIDISQTAIDMAKELHPFIRFERTSFDHIIRAGRRFDLVVSSNVLEHFKHYRAVLRQWLMIAPAVLLIVPYKESGGLMDNEIDGGQYHSTRFDEWTLAGFKRSDGFVFYTRGWQSGESPRQWAVLVEGQCKR